MGVAPRPNIQKQTDAPKSAITPLASTRASSAEVDERGHSGASPGSEAPRSGTRALGSAGFARKLTEGFRVLTREAEQLFGLAKSWSERLGMARYLAKLYVARALPMDTYDLDTSIRLGGTVYTVGLRSSEIYVLEEVLNYELYDRLGEYVAKRHWVVFDLGANVGVVSLLHAKRGAKVYSFEPNPDCYRRLLKNVLANGLERQIHTFNLALGSEVGSGSLSVSKGGTTGGTVAAGDGATESSVRVPVTTLDQVVRAIGVSRIDLLKMDVEGAEADVLEGADHALERTERVILEYHSAELLRRVEQLLRAKGFACEHRIVYEPEAIERGQQEVGILYARRIAA